MRDWYIQNCSEGYPKILALFCRPGTSYTGV